MRGELESTPFVKSRQRFSPRRRSDLKSETKKRLRSIIRTRHDGAAGIGNLVRDGASNGLRYR